MSSIQQYPDVSDMATFPRFVVLDEVGSILSATVSHEVIDEDGIAHNQPDYVPGISDKSKYYATFAEAKEFITHRPGWTVAFDAEGSPIVRVTLPAPLGINKEHKLMVEYGEALREKQRGIQRGLGPHFQLAPNGDVQMFCVGSITDSRHFYLTNILIERTGYFPIYSTSDHIPTNNCPDKIRELYAFLKDEELDALASHEISLDFFDSIPSIYDYEEEDEDDPVQGVIKCEAITLVSGDSGSGKHR
jgi:hypothetical protein